MFKDQSLLITGGTGSFGRTVLKNFLSSDIREIRILSRDEKKQDDLRRKYQNPKIKFYIGDVRDFSSVRAAVRGVDYIFHAAALKQVPSCEFFPLEAVKTNVLGTENVLEAAVREKVKKVICLSTDKAVYPINAMGISKAMMERVIVAKSRNFMTPVICAVRYGNVMASRGSVIPLFVSQIHEGKPITVTDPNMTRFMMTLNQAIDLVLFAFKNGKPGQLFVQKSPAATIETLAKAITQVMGVPDHPIHSIGTRHGEKLYESLLSREERFYAQDLEHYYSVSPDQRDMNYTSYFDSGEKDLLSTVEYNSHNTDRLGVDEMIKMLKDLPYIQEILKGNWIDSEE
jgi:UDP-N-acetylglucosamine 4,6-dehydratase